jgi:hypothetical protein
MQGTAVRYRILALLGMMTVLAIAWGMDQLLVYQTKLASATFNFTPLFVISAACVLIMIALWFGLGWSALFQSGYSRLIWITFLVVGLFWALVLYLWLFIPWQPLHRMAWALDFEYSRPIMKPTTMFITVLGLLNLTLRSRSRLGA